MNKIVNKILVALLATVLVFISSNTTEIFAMNPEEVVADGKYHVVDFSSGEDMVLLRHLPMHITLFRQTRITITI